MFNAIRMDVYRLFKTKSTYIILVIMLAMSVMGDRINVCDDRNDRGREATGTDRADVR